MIIDVSRKSIVFSIRRQFGVRKRMPEGADWFASVPISAASHLAFLCLQVDLPIFLSRRT